VLGVFVIPAVLLGGTMMWVSSVRPRIADPMAIHWNAAGQVNGTSTLGSFIVIPIGMTVALWALGALMLLAGRTSRVRFRYQRWAMVWCCGTTAFFTGLLVLTVQANLDKIAATATLAPISLLALLGLSALGGLIGWALAGSPPAAPAFTAAAPPQDASVATAGAPSGFGPTPGASTHPTLRRLEPGEHPVWERHLSSVLLTTLTVCMVVTGLVLIPIVLIAGIIVLLSSLCCIPFTSLTTIVDEHGLLVRFGPFGFPHKRIPLAEIASVRVDDIEPIEWGGWGYRVGPGRSAAVLRGGPGIVVELRDGRLFAVTINDPDEGVALLQAYSHRASHP